MLAFHTNQGGLCNECLSIGVVLPSIIDTLERFLPSSLSQELQSHRIDRWDLFNVESLRLCGVESLAQRLLAMKLAFAPLVEVGHVPFGNWGGNMCVCDVV